MSPTSYRTAPPRTKMISWAAGNCKNGGAGRGEARLVHTRSMSSAPGGALAIGDYGLVADGLTAA
ncbi:MAG TPA: hypothetical protein VN788_00830, partial [Verrucomicrobiae bacterium]|nr:hypothetical protein [Verrucomicrobiae bacterium]